jgi:hypothetical protein
MAKNLRIENTDSKAEREMATFAPYSSASVTVLFLTVVKDAASRLDASCSGRSRLYGRI